MVWSGLVQNVWRNYVTGHNKNVTYKAQTLLGAFGAVWIIPLVDHVDELVCSVCATAYDVIGAWLHYFCALRSTEFLHRCCRFTIPDMSSLYFSCFTMCQMFLFQVCLHLPTIQVSMTMALQRRFTDVAACIVTCRNRIARCRVFDLKKWSRYCDGKRLRSSSISAPFQKVPHIVVSEKVKRLYLASWVWLQITPHVA